MTHISAPQLRLLALGAALATSIAVLLAGCASAPLPPPPPPPPTSVKPAPPPPPPPIVVVPPEQPIPESASKASTPKEYRKDAASHLYAKNSKRIYHGKMPPLLYAVGVLQVEVDGMGQVTRTSWTRAPSHAPEVMAEIERMVRQAAPYPAPVRMGRVTYTDTWLWHKSGLFQLDTLTEGQF